MDGSTTSYLLPDGTTVEIAGDGFLASGSWFGSFMFQRNDLAGGFQFGPIGTGERSMMHYDDFLLTERYSYRNGDILVGESAGWPGDDWEVAVGIWRGTYHDLYSIGVPDRFADRFVSWLELYDIVDDEAGVLALPRPNSDVWMFDVRVQTDVSPLGTVSVAQRTATTNDLLPPWVGTEVDGGELFRASSDHDDGDPHFVLVTDTSLCVVQATDGKPIDYEARLSGLSRVQVTISEPFMVRS